MYLISAYFDEKTSHELQKYINAVAQRSGNIFMTENNVPPHLTISAFETRNVQKLVDNFEGLFNEMKSGRVDFVTVGAFMPYVLYASPVLNLYLEELSERVYELLSVQEDVRISRFYRPKQWIPHITLGKKLSREEMLAGFSAMQQYFQPVSGRIVRIGLAETNPLRDIVVKDLL